jgi:hypothetical protein
MIKCYTKAKSNITCFSKSGKLKSRWNTQDEAIKQAKYLNGKFHKEDDFKLVPYKCNNCHKYHLTRKKKRVRYI